MYPNPDGRPTLDIFLTCVHDHFKDTSVKQRGPKRKEGIYQEWIFRPCIYTRGTASHSLECEGFHAKTRQCWDLIVLAFK